MAPSLVKLHHSPISWHTRRVSITALEAFKFNGQQIVKIVGWSKSMDGSTEWIMENSWGADWGENGYARVHSGKGDLNLDQYAISPSVIPYTAYDYYSMQ